jgi:hypothetical protein
MGKPSDLLDALRSIADLIREAIRKVVLKPPSAGLVAIWDGEPRHSSVDHDRAEDQV